MVAAGVDGLEHVPTEGPLDEPFVALAAARGVTLTPTLATIRASWAATAGRGWPRTPTSPRSSASPGALA